MAEFYDCYLKTKNKKAIEKFKGVPVHDLHSYEEVKDLPEYAGRLSEGSVLVDLDDSDQAEILMNIVEDLQLNCRVYVTNRGRHFLFKDPEIKIQKCYTHCTLACGLVADIKVGTKNSYEVLKYEGKERFIEWDKDPEKDYDQIPVWLFPIGKKSSDFISMDAGSGRNQALFNYILTLQSEGFSIEESRSILQIINQYILKEPLDQDELETLSRDDAFQKPIFFMGTTFLHDQFGNYLISKYNIKRINGQLCIYDQGIYKAGCKDIESAMIKEISNLNRSKRQEVLSYLDIKEKDNTPLTDPHMIAFRNGVLDISTGELHDFSPDSVILNQIRWDYNPNAYCELTDVTLNKIACQDPEIRSLIEEMIGSCFYASNEHGRSFILIGSGSNGKSKLLDTIKYLLGKENYSALDLKKLGDRFSTIMLYGKLANIGDDISDEQIGDTAIFKKIVTGETIDAEQKGMPKINFDPFCTLIFSANNIPRIGSGSDAGAIIRRIVPVPFNAVFSQDDPDFNASIGEDLKTQESMEYLVKIGIEGLQRVLKNQSYTKSKKVEKELSEYSDELDPIQTYFKEVGKDDVFRGSDSEVYLRFELWCEHNGIKTYPTKIKFSKKVMKMFNLKKRESSRNGMSLRYYDQNF